MIHYDIDATENAYCNLEGDVESLIELKTRPWPQG